jgi:beta-glucosidase
MHHPDRRNLFAGVVALALLVVPAGAVRAAAEAPSIHLAGMRPVYLDAAQPVEARVEDLLSRLTLEEKISLVHGDSKFTTAAIPRLDLPRRWMSDGPHGVREDVNANSWYPAGRTDDFATCLPVGIALAATWNPEAAQAYGDVIGEEALKRGKNIMLGPGVNLMRTPLNGRNAEYLGEDPWLASRLVVEYIRAVQAHDVASCVKHFAANNQETKRNSINVEMDERTLREIYLPVFEAAVKEAHVWAVMGAYNKFRGQFCCENDYLLNRVLKQEWGFPGLVMSDWGGTHDTGEAAAGGLDLEMGTNRPYNQFYLADAFRDGLQKGEYPMAALDDKVRRNLRVMIATHVLDGRPEGSINTKAHQAAARRVAEEAMVLLKNDGPTLPLDPAKLTSIAVIGDDAVRSQAYGGDSARIKAFYEISPLDGILRRVGASVNVTFSEGYAKDGDAAALAARAVQAAKTADVAIVVAGLTRQRPFDCEGADRHDLKLPYGQDELIRQVVQANPRTIVVLVSGGPVEMDAWLDRVPAVVQAWYGGMEGGNALARLLFGDVNPSGKLPCTFPGRIEDTPAYAGGARAYPGESGTERYDEGLLVGYRWYDTKAIEPRFPFGFGLSYTTFAYSNLKLVAGADPKDPVVTVQFDLANTGTREGAEVAQVYVHQTSPSLPRPFKELKGFRKVFLQPGEKQTITLPLERRAFAFYDPAQGGWRTEKDVFRILVGSSSRDLRLQGDFPLPEAWLAPK